ncbi:hypothetical protein NA57DRAFT_71055 [Rhizodiscina lignyota]|uniref:Exosome complex component CSL4 C-terminal domain-containing protein n=1 Tax=Rhizodiscina lignyota TaxID=1504668 RepID=A0A9P4IV39_9PEZI|nr:hypothetical protein NA57DRAFT_71055 [Rhizodiscina lignyota]
MTSALLLPGDSLKSDEHSPGSGTHKYGAHLCASICGPVHRSHGSAKRKAASTSSKALAHSSISISRPRNAPLLPEVNNAVLARITRLTPRSAACSILAIYPSSNNSTSTSNAATLPPPPSHVEPIPVPQQSQFSGQIRAQDVRATEKDKVVMSEAFRVGDVVRAVVISLGDQRDFYLSTAGNDYGVILAWSMDDTGTIGGGSLMAPLSWQTMKDPDTGKTEKRKVAKPL